MTIPSYTELMQDQMLDNQISINVEEFQVKVITNIDEIENIRVCWEEMQWNPKTILDLYLNVIEFRKEFLQPYIILGIYSNKIVTMLIGYIEQKEHKFKFGYTTLFKTKIRLLTFVYGGLLGNCSAPINDLFISQIMHMLKKGEADSVFFDHLLVDSQMYKLARKKPGFFCRDHVVVPNVHWEMNLPLSIDDFFKQLSPKARQKYRRRIRKFEKEQEVNIKYFKIKDDVKQLCNDVEEIAKTTYQRGLGVGFYNNNEIRQDLIVKASHGWLCSYVLYVANKPCAFWIGTIYKEKFFVDYLGYDSHYKQYIPGSILFIKMIEDLCENTNVTVVDFSYGQGFYKEYFGNKCSKETPVYIYAPTIKGIKLNFLKTIIILPSNLIKQILNRLNLLQKVKTYWRTLLAKN